MERLIFDSDKAYKSSEAEMRFWVAMANNIKTKHDLPKLREEIFAASAEQPVFPLVRAIDFVLTGDPLHYEILEPATQIVAAKFLDIWAESFEIPKYSPAPIGGTWGV